MAFCPLCQNPAAVNFVPAPYGGLTTWQQVQCETCGVYDITYLLRQFLKTGEPERRYSLSGATRHAHERGEVLRLATENASAVQEAVPRPDRVEQANLLLDYIARNEGDSRSPVRVAAKLDYPVVFGTPATLQFLVESLVREELIRRAEKTTIPHYLLEFKAHERLKAWRGKKRMEEGLTGWARADLELELVRRQLAEAKVEADYQAVGHRCREIILSVAQAAFDSSKHSAPGISSGHAEGLLAAFFSAEMRGGQHEQARALARKAEAFAGSVAHDRTGTLQEAALAVEAVAFVARIVSIVAGRRDRG